MILTRVAGLRRGLFWLAVAVSAIVTSSCGQTSSSVQGPTSPVAASGPAKPSRPPGGPVPTQLLGDWYLAPAIVVVVTGDSSCRLLRLTLAASAYRLTHTDKPSCGTSSSGEVVVNGSEIDFFNADVCGLRLPQGIGRYRWSVAGDVLTFVPMNQDPCPRGAAWLANRNYSRANTA